MVSSFFIRKELSLALEIEFSKAGKQYAGRTGKEVFLANHEYNFKLVKGPTSLNI
jgi:hypothetical protein